MKLKRTVLLAACVVALGLMLVALFAPTAHAQQVTVEVNPGEPCNPASDISFETERDAYVIDVLFKDNKTLEYGEGTHSFFFIAGAGQFLGYAYFVSLLDAAGDVIPETIFFGGFPSDADPAGLPAILNLSQTTVFSGMRFFATDFNEDDEVEPGLPQSPFYNLSWFSTPPTVIPEGDPVTIGGTVTGLESSGLVLQNNGADNLPIEDDGDFEFPTPLETCRTYNVTVLTNPTNPTQICNVENGKGDVLTEDVTDVAVTCVEPELAGIKKVAAEGDTLGDTVLLDILLAGGVAINDLGEVAFHGQPDRSTRAVFTQFGVVAKVGDTLLDGSTLEYINQNGGVAINYLGEVAFQGKTGNVTAVFIADGETTQVVAKVGDILLDGNSLDGISLGVAINFFGEVAFHGRTDDSKAVFTQNGVVAKVGDFLDDASTLNDIWTDGGVAITPYGPEVAFHGQTGTADAVTDAVLVGQAPVADGEETSGE